MTEQEYIGIQAREPGTQTSSSQLFAFFRVRNGTATRFFPGVGSTIHFANRDTDTCSLRSILPSFLTYGDSVRITYKANTVFLGTVEKIIDRHGAGSERMQDITCAGPWGKLARMVFRQGWYNGADYSDFSKVILNQYQDGTAINLNTQLGYILDASKTVCGFTKGQVSVSTVKLPYDETRDITVADAIRRELRFFPKAIVRFDYSTSTPTLNIVRGENTAQDASYVATVKKSERTYEYTAHPITGVDIEIETTGEIEGVSYRNITHQTAGNVNANNIDCLHATLPIEGASASTVHASLDCKTEDIPASLNDVSWWKQKHPRLANVATGYITITGGTRSGSATAAQYPRISTASVGEIEEAGLHAREEKFTCRCKISTPDDEEEEILLTMNFVTTNAMTKKYTWVASSSSSSGQSVPTGLAAAILADRCGNLKNESMVVRLGAATDFPVLGDRCDNLFLQSFDVDCADLTASLNFGQPEYLSIEDMAGLLTGFRNRSSSSSSVSRQSGKKEDEGKELEIGGIPPISSTEFAPGKKTKTAVATSGGDGSSVKLDASTAGGNIELKTEDVESGQTIAAHTLSWTDEDGEEQSAQILSTGDIEIPPGTGGSGEGDDVSIEANEDEKLQLKDFAAGSSEESSVAEDIASDVEASYEVIVRKDGVVKYVPIGRLSSGVKDITEETGTDGSNTYTVTFFDDTKDNVTFTVPAAFVSKIVGTGAIHVDPASGTGVVTISSNVRNITAGAGINVSLSGNDIVITNTREGGSAETEGHSGTIPFIDGFKYDTSSHKLMCRFGSITVENGLITGYTAGSSWADISAGGQAVEETV